MINIVRYYENYTNSLPEDLLTIVSMFSVICGISVIVSKNPILSVLFLIGLFSTIASYLMILGISFIGLSYLLVYVGAVSILFLFILMLINVRVSEFITDNYNSVPLSVLTIMVFSVIFEDKIPSASSSFTSSPTMLFDTLGNKESNTMYFSTSGDWDSALSQVSHITSIGNILYTSYPMLLLITSIILLLAMVGAIVITIKQ